MQTNQQQFLSFLLSTGSCFIAAFPVQVVIWDDDRNRCVGELVFRSEVKGVRLRRDRVVVQLEHKVYVYSLVDLRLLAHLDTMPGTTHGSRTCHVGGELLAVSQAPHNFVLACLGLQRGQVCIDSGMAYLGIWRGQVCVGGGMACMACEMGTDV